MAHRALMALSAGALATMMCGCGTVQNLGTKPFGDCNQPPGLVYGGVRSDFVSYVSYPIGSPLPLIPCLVADAIGDTLTLPIILARQGVDFAKSRLPDPPASPTRNNETTNGAPPTGTH